MGFVRGNKLKDRYRFVLHKRGELAQTSAALDSCLFTFTSGSI